MTRNPPTKKTEDRFKPKPKALDVAAGATAIEDENRAELTPSQLDGVAGGSVNAPSSRWCRPPAS
jgi:hypothetical protein